MRLANSRSHGIARGLRRRGLGMVEFRVGWQETRRVSQGQQPSMTTTRYSIETPPARSFVISETIVYLYFSASTAVRTRVLGYFNKRNATAGGDLRTSHTIKPNFRILVTRMVARLNLSPDFILSSRQVHAISESSCIESPWNRHSTRMD
jgi:hypothetical protein